MSKRKKTEYIVIHHSLTKDGNTKDWEAIRRYHIETNGWSDIGYHLGIDKINDILTIQTGRDIDDCGAHTKEMNMNNISVGICVVGNYDEEAPTDKHYEVLCGLVYPIMQKYNIPPKNVIGHWEVGKMAGFDREVEGQYKSCPGWKFDMNKVRATFR